GFFFKWILAPVICAPAFGDWIIRKRALRSLLLRNAFWNDSPKHAGTGRNESDPQITPITRMLRIRAICVIGVICGLPMGFRTSKEKPFMPTGGLEDVARAVVRRARLQGFVLARDIRAELARAGLPEGKWSQIVSLAHGALELRQ